MTSFKMLLALATTYDVEVEQMDVKTTFFHGCLQEIFMEQSKGLVVGGKNLVCKLTRWTERIPKGKAQKI